VQRRTVDVNGSPIEVAQWEGDRDETPIVLLHEGLGSIGLWRDFPIQLRAATARSVIGFSRHGHGRSGPAPHPRTPAFFHEEALDTLPQLLRRLDVHEPILVGHSDGASIALIHAAHHPTTAAVLIAPHVFVEAKTVEAISQTRQNYLAGELRARMTRHHVDPDAAFWGWCDVWLDSTFTTWTLEHELQRLACPVLVIQGVDDPYGSLEQLDRIEASARGPVERLEVPGGHSPHLENGPELAAAVATFLDARCVTDE
jgi:pimeloyl-ACP methyl ester carboxylesterase